MTRFLDSLDVRYEFLTRSLNLSDAPTLSAKLRRQLQRVRTESEVRRHLRKFDLRDNILHIETAPWQSLAHLAALSLRGANIFVTMHNFMPRSSKWREATWKLRLQIVSRLKGMHIVASNRDTKERLRGWVSEKFWDDITVAHTAVNPEQIDAARMSRTAALELRNTHSIPRDKTVILAVGQFIDRKGRWVFMDAARRALETDRGLFFVWLTPKLPDAAARQRIDSYGLGDSLKIVLSETLGRERMDVLRFFNIADIFALPSYIEGLPIALLEAMAIGVPSVSTNIFAIPEAVIDMKTGLLIEPGRGELLADAILRLKNDDELRGRLAADGREFVLKNFDERDAARKVIAAYKRCFADG
jgi:glycosyltransferase involved in cell wall biosynthesis